MIRLTQEDCEVVIGQIEESITTLRTPPSRQHFHQPFPLGSSHQQQTEESVTAARFLPLITT